MTSKIVIMVGCAFSIGVIVGLLFHLPGTTGPSTYRTSQGRDEYTSSKIYPAWGEGLTQGENSLLSLLGNPFSANTDRSRDGSRVVQVKPGRDYLINSDTDRPVNNSNRPDKDYINRNIKLPVFQDYLTTTTNREGRKRTSETVGSRIISVLRDIKIVQIERDNIISDISQRNLHSGQGLFPADIGHLKPAEDDSANSPISNIPGENVEGKTSIVNRVKSNRASRYVLEGESKGSHFVDDQTDVKIHTAADSRGKPIDIVTGVFWSEELEKRCPTGFSQALYTEWRERINDANVMKVEDGCGRMQNRKLTFQDGSSACARYRPNTDQIQGEIYSYYLSRLLNINNVPPSVILPVNSSDKVWANVEQEIAMSQWGEEKLVVLTKWVEGLEPAYIPTELKGKVKQLYPNDVHLLNRSVSDLCEILQWSDLIIFDYLTANLDRIVNNMFNEQWNSEMMSYPAHNLHKIKDSESLVFLDNESGLFHGYRLLDKYSKYHEEMLSSLCVFRKSTVQRIEQLFLADNIDSELNGLLNSREPQASNLPQMPEKNMLILKQRLQDVFEQIQSCHRKLSR